ncbi:hypothetical protein ABIB81_008554 [Bradyrhizobium sp. I1.7.5]
MIRFGLGEHVGRKDQEMEVEQGLANWNGEPFCSVRGHWHSCRPVIINTHHRSTRAARQCRELMAWIQVEPAASDFAVAPDHPGSSTTRVRYAPLR